MVDGQLFVLLDSAPAGGDQVTIKGTSYTAIWSGKTNTGRSRRNWWVAIIQHPHCRCNFIRQVPGFQKIVNKFRAALEREQAKVEQMEGSHQQYSTSEYMAALKKYGVMTEK